LVVKNTNFTYGVQYSTAFGNMR